MEELKKDQIKTVPVNLSTVLFSYTTPSDYEMSRTVLVNTDFGEYVIIRGSHCSCYDFDDSVWHGTKYNREELIKLAPIWEKDYSIDEQELGSFILKYFSENQ
jgi:hypothetical protein